MQTTIFYALGYAATVGLLLFWRLSQLLITKARHHLRSVFFRWIFDRVIFPRLRGSSDITILSSIVIAGLFVANIAGTWLLNNQAVISLRLARLCITNLVCLYLGGRSNVLHDKVLRSHTEQHLLHRWIGRVTLLEGLTHGALELIRLRATTRPQDIAVSWLLLHTL